MIEIVENAAQLALLLVCVGVAAVRVIREREERATMLFLFYTAYALGDLSWLLYLLYTGHTPIVFYVSELSWYAAYLFLYLLLQLVSSPQERQLRHPALLAVPAFCVAMFAFYMSWGDLFGNVVSAVLMTLLMTHAIRGLIYLRARPGEAARRMLYVATLVFCAMEYGDWTTSCFWSGDTWANPYFISDCLLTISFVFFLPAYKRAVSK